MKVIDIKVMVDEENKKIGTLINKNGYNISSIGDTLELIGLFENLKLIQLDNLRNLVHKKG